MIEQVLGWKLYLAIIIVGFVILWLIWGGKKQEFIGFQEILDEYARRAKENPHSWNLMPEEDDPQEDSIAEGEADVRVEEEEEEPVHKPEPSPIKIDRTPALPPGFPILPQVIPEPPIKRSKMEARCCQILEEIYGKPFIRDRPNFLQNPETGRNLELDCVNHELKIALEYNSSYHYQWPNFTGQTLQDFLNTVRRDRFKIEMCDRNGYYLITAPFNVPPHMMKDYITYYLPENVRKRIKQ